MNIGDVMKVAAGIWKIVNTPEVKRSIFGEYSDGTPRSVVDGIYGEILSPKQKKKKKYKKKKKKHKKVRFYDDYDYYDY